METAITMPLFVFLILGLLQLGLMHQARIMTKYAAFKAVRVGSIHNAKKSAMRRAAAAVLLPMLGRRNTDSFYNATTSGMKGFSGSWASLKSKVDSTGTDAPLELIVCGPRKQSSSDFDDPDGDLGHQGGSWEGLNNGRLIVQIATHYQLVIPFANGVIWHIVAGTQKAELMRTVRLAPKNDQFQPYMQSLQSVNHGQRKIEQFRGMANNNKYVMPIRASWSMRMQSNFLSTNNDFKLPTKNLCHVPWAMKDK